LLLQRLLGKDEVVLRGLGLGGLVEGLRFKCVGVACGAKLDLGVRGNVVSQDFGVVLTRFHLSCLCHNIYSIYYILSV
jgi:hypothetical protein